VLVRHEAAQGMREGPSGPACRSRLQTTLSCFPQRREVVSVEEKAWLRLCQVRFRETSASEPLMRCRKQVTTTSKLEANTTPGGVQGKPIYCLGGVRHKGGANLIQALVWNVGTCRSDVKGETQVETPQG
jgi:hypothetical protein